jgi:hypothetical protein
MAGRPPASYAYPKIWGHLADLGFHASHRGLVKLRHLHGYNPSLGSISSLSNRFLETKCRADQPSLVDYDMAHELVGMISFHRVRVGKPALNAPTEIVRFDHQIVNLPNLHVDRMNEHGDEIGMLAARTGLTVEAISAALAGRLLPLRVCAHIVGVAGGDPSRSIRKFTPSSKALPLNDADCLRTILPWLAAA